MSARIHYCPPQGRKNRAKLGNQPAVFVFLPPVFVFWQRVIWAMQKKSHVKTNIISDMQALYLVHYNTQGKRGASLSCILYVNFTDECQTVLSVWTGLLHVVCTKLTTEIRKKSFNIIHTLDWRRIGRKLNFFKCF